MTPSTPLDETQLALPAAIPVAAGPIAWIAAVLQSPAGEAAMPSAACQSLARQPAMAAAIVWRVGGAPLYLEGDLAAQLRQPPLADKLQQLITGAPSAAVCLPARDRLGCPGRLLVASSRDGWTVAAILDDSLGLPAATTWLRAMQTVADRLADGDPDPTRQRGTNDLAAASSYQRLHQSLDLRETCNSIASDGHLLLGVDRASVILKRRRRWVTIAVSGVSQINRRSAAVRGLERLVDVVAKTETAFQYPDEVAPQINEVLEEYLDLTAVDRLQLLPLMVPAAGRRGTDPDRQPREGMAAMLVLESFAGQTEAVAAVPSDSFVAHAQTALANSLEHHHIFGLSLWKFLGRFRQRSARLILLAVAGVLAIVAYALFTVQVDHYVVAHGTLQPRHQLHLFAPEDSVVRTLHVQHGSVVDPGDRLLTLQSADLERRLEETLAQLQTVTRRLAAIRSTRLAGRGTAVPRAADAGPGADIDPLASEEQQLATERDGLDTQRALLSNQLESLQVLSPMAGTVISWDLAQTLGDRPVSRGHRLLTVADLQGRWQLETTIDEADWGAIAAAQTATGSSPDEPLPVEFVLSLEPEKAYRATVVRMSEAAQADPEGGARIAVEMDIEPDETMPLRAGAQGRAKIFTGKRSIAASWFEDLRRATFRYLWFPFQRAT